MKGPAKFGAIVYAKEIQELSVFYRELFDLTLLTETAELVSLGGDGFNVVVHTSPIELSELSCNTVKIFVAVDSLDDVRRCAIELGGHALDGEWQNPMFKVCNIEYTGQNHIQLREFLA